MLKSAPNNPTRVAVLAAALTLCESGHEKIQVTADIDDGKPSVVNVSDKKPEPLTLPAINLETTSGEKLAALNNDSKSRQRGTNPAVDNIADLNKVLSERGYFNRQGFRTLDLSGLLIDTAQVTELLPRIKDNTYINLRNTRFCYRSSTVDQDADKLDQDPESMFMQKLVLDKALTDFTVLSILSNSTTYLTDLDLENVLVSDRILDILKKCRLLNDLNLSGTEVSDKIIVELPAFYSLRSLSLSAPIRPVIEKNETPIRVVDSTPDDAPLPPAPPQQDSPRGTFVERQTRNGQKRRLYYPDGKSTEGDQNRVERRAALPDVTRDSYQDGVISDLAVRGIINQTSLEHLELEGLQTTDLSVQWLDQLPNLRSLKLGGGGITDVSMKYLANIPNLRTLDVSSMSQLTENGIAEIAKLRNLRVLRISKFDGPSHAAINGSMLKHFSDHPRLEILELVGQRITNDDLKPLATIPRLRILDLSYCPIGTNEGTKNDLSIFLDISNLAELDLSHTGLTDLDFELLLKHDNLSWLNVSGCNVKNAKIYSRNLNSAEAKK